MEEWEAAWERTSSQKESGEGGDLVKWGQSEVDIGQIE